MISDGVESFSSSERSE